MQDTIKSVLSKMKKFHISSIPIFNEDKDPVARISGAEIAVRVHMRIGTSYNSDSSSSTKKTEI